MGVFDYNTLKAHLGHNFECVTYGSTEDPLNVALECVDCNEVIIDYDRPVTESRHFDKEFAETLDAHMNQPYELSGQDCSNCPNDDPFNYELTGYIVDDGQGLYVEKKCRQCGQLTTEGDGDFYDYYEITEEGIISKEGIS